MAANFRFPWSGDVSEWINPVTTWFSGNQNSLLQVNYASSAPQVEEKIVRDVAGYGRQLGKISDALEAISSLPIVKDNLDPKQLECVEAFEKMAAKIRQAKEEMLMEELSSYHFRSLMQNIKDLQKAQPELYTKLKEEVKNTFALEEKPEKKPKTS